MRRTAAVFIWIPFAAGLVLSGCGGRPHVSVTEAEQAERSSILDAIDAADDTDFTTSFRRLSDYSFNRYIRTEQYDEDDYVVAYDEFLVRMEGRGDRRNAFVERTDSAGSFDFGFFSRFVSENVETPDPVDLIPYVLPDDADYDDPRRMDLYRFRILADTLLWDRPAHVYEARARPESGDGLNVRVVRQYVDVETNKLVGIFLERVDLALLFREESRFYVDLKPGPDGSFLPYNTRFETRIRMPFRGEYRIRTVSTFSGFQDAAAP